MPQIEIAQDEKFVEIDLGDLGYARVYAQGEEPEQGEYEFSPVHDGTGLAHACAASDHWTGDHLSIYVLDGNEFDHVFGEELALCVRGDLGCPYANRGDVDAALISDDGFLYWDQCWVTADSFASDAWCVADFGPAADGIREYVFVGLGD